MTNNKSSIRAEIASLVQQALDLGPRGDLRKSLEAALDEANGTAPTDLTDLRYRQLKAGNRLTDPKRMGFIMVASDRGAKRWLYRSQKDGKQQQVTLGTYPAMSLSEARSEWERVSSEGIAPAVADRRSLTTVKELVAGYLTYTQDRKDFARVEKTLNKHLVADHGDMKISDLTAEVLEARYMDLIETQRGAARNIRTPLMAMMNWAARERRLPVGMSVPRLFSAGKSGIKTYYPKTGELRTALGLLPAMGVAGDIIHFQLLTTTRISEAREADWSEIDLDERRWEIPASRMKNGEPHTVMLSDAAVAILARQSEREGLVFGSMSHSNLMKHWREARAVAGLPTEYGTHTHRKACLSWVAEQGGNEDIRGRLSAHHSGGGVDAHYQRSELNKPAAEWWQRWADHLAAVGADNVVLMSEERA